MKTVYIDVLVTVNIFVDFFLIMCTAKCLHIKVKLKRMILGSVIGGAESLLALLPALWFGLNILLDLAGAAVIIFAVFGKCNAKTYIKRLAVYFSFSFSFCGIMIFVYTSFRPKGMEIYNDVVYFNISPVVLIILTLVCYYILKLIKRLTNCVNGKRTCNVAFVYDNRTFSFCAKIDTGCTLKEPFSGFNVIVMEESLLDGYYPDESKMRIIPFGSLGGEGIIKGLRPTEIKIEEKDVPNEVYIGICRNVIKGDIKALIPSELADQNT